MIKFHFLVMPAWSGCKGSSNNDVTHLGGFCVTICPKCISVKGGREGVRKLNICVASYEQAQDRQKATLKIVRGHSVMMLHTGLGNCVTTFVREVGGVQKIGILCDVIYELPP